MAEAEGGGGTAQPGASATPRWSDSPPRRPTAGGHLGLSLAVAEAAPCPCAGAYSFI